jgi:uncharacterized heparinase superfamily protein
VSLIPPFRCRLQAFAYGSPLYRLFLDRGPVPDGLRLTLNDPWPGNAEAGQALIGQTSGLFERQGPDPRLGNLSVLTHGWLRDLRAVGTEAARRKALALIEEWLARHDGWREDGWAPAIIGERLTNWVRFYDFYAATASSNFPPRLIASLQRQWRHMLRCLPGHLIGVESLCAIKGLLAGGMALSDSGKALGLGLELLRRQLFAEILADGGHVSRNPFLHMQVLRHLIDLRDVLRAAGHDAPHELITAIERMAPALKLFRHGDGALALFNGAFEASPLEIDAVLTLSGTRGRVSRRLAHAGYERLTAGRSLLLVDAGAPAPIPYDKTAHAGLLSFEFSLGRERLIVNCGARPGGDAEWHLAMAATAAHSTLTLGHTNACEIRGDGGIGHRPSHVSAQRYEQEGAHYVEAVHNGYEKKFQVTHHRSLCLAGDGEALHGRDVLAGPSGRDFTVRWHLHPAVQASLAQGGQTALLRLPSGNGWRLKVARGSYGGVLSLEPSVYSGGPVPRRTLQIKVSGRTQEDPTVVSWLLTREQKG